MLRFYISKSFKSVQSILLTFIYIMYTIKLKFWRIGGKSISVSLHDKTNSSLKVEALFNKGFSHWQNSESVTAIMNTKTKKLFCLSRTWQENIKCSSHIYFPFTCVILYYTILMSREISLTNTLNYEFS